jgi:hypothetical protein
LYVLRASDWFLVSAAGSPIAGDVQLRLPMTAATSDVAMEAGGIKKRPRASAVVGAAAWLFIPMAISHAQSFIGSTHWIVNNERSAWRG